MDATSSVLTKSIPLTSEAVVSPPTPLKKSTQIEGRRRKSPSRFLVKNTANGVIRRKLKGKPTHLKLTDEVKESCESILRIKSVPSHRRKSRLPLTCEKIGLNIEPLDIYMDNKCLKERRASLIQKVEVERSQFRITKADGDLELRDLKSLNKEELKRIASLIDTSDMIGKLMKMEISKEFVKRVHKKEGEIRRRAQLREERRRIEEEREKLANEWRAKGKSRIKDGRPPKIEFYRNGVRVTARVGYYEYCSTDTLIAIIEELEGSPLPEEEEIRYDCMAALEEMLRKAGEK